MYNYTRPQIIPCYHHRACVLCIDSLDESQFPEELQRPDWAQKHTPSLDGFQGIPRDADPKPVLATQHFSRQRRLCLHTEKRGQAEREREKETAHIQYKRHK